MNKDERSPGPRRPSPWRIGDAQQLAERADDACRLAEAARAEAALLRRSLESAQAALRSGLDAHHGAVGLVDETARRRSTLLERPAPAVTLDRSGKVLARFTHLVFEDAEPAGVLAALADVATEHLGADAAVVFSVADDCRLGVAASSHVPERLDGLSVAADALGPDLADRVLEATGRRFARAFLLPLSSGDELFGAIVLLTTAPLAIDERHLDLARALGELATMGMRRAAQLRSLSQAFVALRAARETLGRTERLRALGEMAAGVAHDVKNVFQPLLLNVSLLKQVARDPDAVVELAERLKKTVRRGVDIVERLRRFGQPRSAESEAVADPAALVQEALALARSRPQAGAFVELRAELGPMPPVVVEPTELVATIVNLLANGADVQPRGGRVVVRGGATPSGEAWLEVADEGPGIPPEVQRRIFEPFFTTKGEAGTGLGLANARAFVERHGGKISFATSPAGTTFRLVFPAAPAGSGVTDAASPGALAVDALLDELEESRRLRATDDRIVSRLVDDLGDPLSGVLAGLSLLETSAVGDDAARDVVAFAREGGRKLLALLEDVVEVRLLEQGELPLAGEPVAVRGLVREAVGTLEPMARRAGVSIEVVDGPSPVLTLERKLVGRALVNVLSRALELSPRSSRVTVTIVETAGRVAIAFADRVELSEDARAHIFDKLAAAGAEASRASGLGLHVARLVAAAHGGAAVALAREGGGSVIELRFPAG